MVNRFISRGGNVVEYARNYHHYDCLCSVIARSKLLDSACLVAAVFSMFPYLPAPNHALVGLAISRSLVVKVICLLFFSLKELTSYLV